MQIPIEIYCGNLCKHIVYDLEDSQIVYMEKYDE